MTATKHTDVESRKLLARGNPQIPKADGDVSVQASIAAMPCWKRDVGIRLSINEASGGGQRPDPAALTSTSNSSRVAPILTGFWGVSAAPPSPPSSVDDGAWLARAPSPSRHAS